MQEKSLVGATYKYKGKTIKVLHQDPTEVYFAILKSDGGVGSKSRMDWPSFRKEVIHNNESKVKELLKVLEDTQSPAPGTPQEKSVDWEWEFDHNGKKVYGHFHYVDSGKRASGGSPAHDSTDPYSGEGEMPVLELTGLWDENDNPVQVTPEEKDKIENDAAEKRWQEMHQE